MSCDCIEIVNKRYQWDGDFDFFTCIYSIRNLASEIEYDVWYGLDTVNNFCSITVNKKSFYRESCDYDFTSEIEYIGLNGCDEFYNKDEKKIRNRFLQYICNFILDKERVGHEFTVLSFIANGV